MRDGRGVGWALSLLVAFVAIGAFTPSLSGEFLNWDDGVGLVRNDAYRGLGWSHVRWAFTNTHVGHYMPLTWLSFGVNYVLGGMNPWGYHAANLLLHGVNAGVFLLIAVRLLTAVGHARRAHQVDIAADPHPAPAIVAGALLASLLFAVHPPRVESVAWITGRATLLIGFFYLLAMIGYLRATAGGGPIGWKRAAAAPVSAFIAAVLAHPIAMTLPLSLLVLDMYPLQRDRTWRDLARESAVALRAYMQRTPWDPAGPWRLGLQPLVQSKPVEALPLFRVALDLSADSPAFRGQVDAVLREQASQLERSGRHAEASVLLSERARLVERGSRRPNSP